MITAAGYEWSQVEPAVFGTLLGCTLDLKECAKLGSYYTTEGFALHDPIKKLDVLAVRDLGVRVIAKPPLGLRGFGALLQPLPEWAVSANQSMRWQARASC